MKPITEFFLKAENEVYAAGYSEEIHYFSNLRPFEEQKPGGFVYEYIYVILNSGISAKSAKKIYDRVIKAMETDPENWTDEIPNVPWKKSAICRAVADGQDWFEVIKATAPEERIKVIRTLPGMEGDALGYHLARNMGIDTVKPDRHLKRLAARFDYRNPMEMCLDIQSDFEKKLKLGTIDYILWRYCTIHGSEQS